MPSLDAKLEELYRRNWKRWCTGIPKGCGLSNLLLAVVPSEYEESPIRLVVIGQETHGWWEGGWDKKRDGDRIDWLRRKYRDFDRGRHHHSPFFQAASEVQHRLNPFSDPFGFVWLNLYICDQNRGLAKEPAAESLRKMSVLREEIAILRPDAVIFFAGRAYEYVIKHEHYFPDAEFRPHSRVWKEVKASALPETTAKTYHPKYLRLSKQSGVLTEITDWILRRQAGRARHACL
jgi:hypothetical protein